MKLPWERLQVRINAAGRVRCEAGWRLDYRWSDRLFDYDLWFVWAGRGTMQLRDRAIALRPGALLWMRPGGLYLADQDEADRLGVTFIHFDLLDRRGRPLLRLPLPRESREVFDRAYVGTLTQRIVQVHHGLMGAIARPADSTAVSGQLLRGLLMDVDAAESSPRASSVRRGTERHHHQIVTRAAARLSEDVVNAPPIADLAREAGCTADHLTRLFHKVLGMTPQACLIDARLRRAQQLLAASSLTVSQIAAALGYRDVYFFSRQFKQKTGRTPTQYRQGRM